ncbi:MAG TPA: hypothetical protein PKA23_03835, partial [Accumulibacter sp.]|nr:hypothetical protein [Accumulibacter sp.]HNM64458.1 hypothetical protein [Accumulibacter sp.]
RRYLEHTFRSVFELQGTPLRIQFNVSINPFASEKNDHSDKAEKSGKASAGRRPASESDGRTSGAHAKLSSQARAAGGGVGTKPSPARTKPPPRSR